MVRYTHLTLLYKYYDQRMLSLLHVCINVNLKVLTLLMFMYKYHSKMHLISVTHKYKLYTVIGTAPDILFSMKLGSGLQIMTVIIRLLTLSSNIKNDLQTPSWPCFFIIPSFPFKFKLPPVKIKFPPSYTLSYIRPFIIEIWHNIKYVNTLALSICVEMYVTVNIPSLKCHSMKSGPDQANENLPITFQVEASYSVRCMTFLNFL